MASWLLTLSVDFCGCYSYALAVIQQLCYLLDVAILSDFCGLYPRSSNLALATLENRVSVLGTFIRVSVQIAPELCFQQI